MFREKGEGEKKESRAVQESTMKCPKGLLRRRKAGRKGRKWNAATGPQTSKGWGEGPAGNQRAVLKTR